MKPVPNQFENTALNADEVIAMLDALLTGDKALFQAAKSKLDERLKQVKRAKLAAQGGPNHQN